MLLEASLGAMQLILSVLYIAYKEWPTTRSDPGGSFLTPQTECLHNTRGRANEFKFRSNNINQQELFSRNWKGRVSKFLFPGTKTYFKEKILSHKIRFLVLRIKLTALRTIDLFSSCRFCWYRNVSAELFYNHVKFIKLLFKKRYVVVLSPTWMLPRKLQS